MKQKLCFALDVPTAKDAKGFVVALSDYVGWFKVGLELFLSEGPDVIRYAKMYGNDVILDIKLIDIPTTVCRAVNIVATRHKVNAITIYSAGGPDMVKEVMNEVNLCLAYPIRVFLVTLLTSLTEKSLMALGCQPDGRRETVMKYIQQFALDNGITNFVSSVKDCKQIKLLRDGLFVMTPGIRLNKEENDHIETVATPFEAIEAGSDLLVLGREVRDSDDPVKKVQEIKENMFYGNETRGNCHE